MEPMTATITVMSDWSEQLVSRIAAQIRARRTELGISAQELADRTETLGHPVSRTAIADYELGRRKDRLMIGDALVLAEALRVPLALLLYPEQPDGMVEVFPSVSTDSLTAALSLTGDAVVPFPDDFTNTDDGRTIGSGRINDYSTGTDLVFTTKQLDTHRETLRATRVMFNESMDKGDMEQAQRYHLLIMELQGRIDATADRIRKLGGVVNDG